MKTVALGLLVVLACGLSAFGSDCIVDSYDNYLGTSCGHRRQDLFQFLVFHRRHEPRCRPAASRSIPSLRRYNPGFLFNAPWGVQAGQTQDSLIGFTVNVNPGGNLINDLSLNMFGAGVLGTGQVTVAETYCAGDTFADRCADGTEGTLLTILNSGTSKSECASASFGPVSVVDVVKDIELLGGRMEARRWFPASRTSSPKFRNPAAWCCSALAL